MAQTDATQAGEMDLGEIEGRATEGLKQARTTIEGFARENPRVAVAIALGVGFVLGGGLTPRVLMGLGALAARRAARDYARRQISTFAESAVRAVDHDGPSA